MQFRLSEVPLFRRACVTRYCPSRYERACPPGLLSTSHQTKPTHSSCEETPTFVSAWLDACQKQSCTDASATSSPDWAISLPADPSSSRGRCSRSSTVHKQVTLNHLAQTTYCLLELLTLLGEDKTRQDKTHNRGPSPPSADGHLVCSCISLPILSPTTARSTPRNPLSCPQCSVLAWSRSLPCPRLPSYRRSLAWVVSFAPVGPILAGHSSLLVHSLQPSPPPALLLLPLRSYSPSSHPGLAWPALVWFPPLAPPHTVSSPVEICGAAGCWFFIFRWDTLPASFLHYRVLPAVTVYCPSLDAPSVQKYRKVQYGTIPPPNDDLTTVPTCLPTYWL